MLETPEFHTDPDSWILSELKRMRPILINTSIANITSYEKMMAVSVVHCRRRQSIAGSHCCRGRVEIEKESVQAP